MNRQNLKNMEGWWNNKPGETKEIFCEDCGARLVAVFKVLPEEKLPPILKAWRKEVLNDPLNSPVFKVWASYGGWIASCPCQKEEKIQKAPAIGLPKRFEPVRFSLLKKDDENRLAFTRAFEWAESLPKPKPFGLYLFSDEPGTGKTCLAAASMNLASDKGITTFFVRATEMVDGEQNKLETFKTSKILVIDDFDKARSTDYGIERLFEVIDYRHSEMLPTMITANLGPDAIAAKYGSSMASRLCDKRSFKVVFAGKKDRRLL